MQPLSEKALLSLFDKLLGNKQRLSIMIYHRVLPEQDFMRPDEPTVEEFEWQMEAVAKYFNPMSLSDALEHLDRGALPPRSICITFDDGYADNRTHALPVLQRWNIPATIFVASGYLNGGRMWNDTIIDSVRSSKNDVLNLSSINLDDFFVRTDEEKLCTAKKLIGEIKYTSVEQRSQIASYLDSISPSPAHSLMLSSDQLLEMVDSGIEVGAHTVNHPIMANLSRSEVLKEIEDNVLELESLVSKPIRYFAYPNGKPGTDYLPEHPELVQSLGFKAAVSTTPGVSDINTDRFQLPRFTPWDSSRMKFVLRLLLNRRKLV